MSRLSTLCFIARIYMKRYSTLNPRYLDLTSFSTIIYRLDLDERPFYSRFQISNSDETSFYTFFHFRV